MMRPGSCASAPHRYRDRMHCSVVVKLTPDLGELYAGALRVC